MILGSEERIDGEGEVEKNRVLHESGISRDDVMKHPKEIEDRTFCEELNCQVLEKSGYGFGRMLCDQRHNGVVRKK